MNTQRLEQIINSELKESEVNDGKSNMEINGAEDRRQHGVVDDSNELGEQRESRGSDGDVGGHKSKRRGTQLPKRTSGGDDPD